MRTTIDISDTLFRQVKAASALKGVSLKEFISAAIEHELETQKIRLENRKVSLPLVPSKHPGSLKIDSDIIAKFLEQDDYHVLTLYQCMAGFNF